MAMASQSETYKIRTATVEDCAAIWSLSQELGRLVKSGMKGEPSEKGITSEGRNQEVFTEEVFGTNPACRCFVAEVEQDIVAYAMTYDIFSSFEGRGVALEEIYIKSGYRKTGIGKNLMKAVAQEGAKRGATRMEFGVFDWNANGRAFYKHLGAQNLSEIGLHVHVIEYESFLDLLSRDHEVKPSDTV